MTKRTEQRLLNVEMKAVADGGIVLRIKMKGNETFTKELEKLIEQRHWKCEYYYNEKTQENIYDIDTRKYGDEIHVIAFDSPEFELLGYVFGVEV